MKKLKLKHLHLLIAGLFLTGFLFAHTPSEKDVFATIHKGDSKSYRFTIHNAYSYDEVDLTNFIVKFRVKKSRTDSTYSINKTCTNQDQTASATIGKCFVVLSQSDTDLTTGTYYAYVVITNAGDTISETVLESKLIIANPS